MKNSAKKVAVVGISAVALSVMVAGTAAAQSPPAPSSNGPVNLGTPPLKDSGKFIKTTAQTSGPNAIDLKWEAPSTFTLIQTSQQKPVNVKGVWKFTGAPVAPAVVKGTPKTGGGQGNLAIGQAVHSFHQHISGLAQRRGYYSVVTVPVGPGYKPVQQAYLTTTTSQSMPLATPKNETPKVRKVRMTVSSVKVTKDGDTGLRGKGEVRFGVRLAPDANPLTPSSWGSWSHKWDDYTKADSGDKVTFSTPLTHTITTTESSAFVEVQGYENDIDPGNYCAIEGGASTGQQYSDKCFDAAVAQGSLQLQTKKGSVTTQWVTAQVYRGPALQFNALVKVESWFI